MKPARVEIRRVILHRIPQHRDSDEQAIELSEAESPLESVHAAYLEEKINKSLASEWAWDVIFDPSLKSPVFQLAWSYFDDPSTENFVRVSQECAVHLYRCQDKRNTEGMLAAVECLYGGQPAFALVKLESEDGVRAIAHSIGGKRVFVMQFLKDLLVTARTRVLKVGMVWIDNGQIRGRASDLQLGRGSRSEVALFFLERFLGARVSVDPTVATRRFIEVTCSFINLQVQDPQLKVDLYTHLISAMTDDTPTINPERFAVTKWPLKHRQSYLDALEQASVPISAFPKDKEAVQRELAKITVEFKSGLRLLGPPEAFESKVQLEHLGDGLTRAVVEDILEWLGTRRKASTSSQSGSAGRGKDPFMRNSQST